MKKILMIVLVLSAAGAYSQEIRMPDEKRKEYVKEREENKATSKKDQEAIDAERKKRAELARKRAASTTEKSSPKGPSVYCLIREMSNLDDPNPKVTMNVEDRFSDRLKRTEDPTAQKHLMMAVEKRKYSSGLEALTALTQSNWTLLETSVYSWKDMAVHEYLLEYQLP